jgi:hypothetical protein
MPHSGSRRLSDSAPGASCFEEKPAATLRLIDPVLEEACGCKVTCIITNCVHRTCSGSMLEISDRLLLPVAIRSGNTGDDDFPPPKETAIDGVRSWTNQGD